MAQSLKATQPSSQVDAMPRLRLQFLNILIRISFWLPLFVESCCALLVDLSNGPAAVDRSVKQLLILVLEPFPQR
jgi:hypothetical protein